MSAPRSPSGESVSLRAAAPSAALIAIIAATLLLRLIVGGSMHLTEDEAYYRLWSFSPALGYEDHPPMIAWWIWLGRHLAGDTPLGVRLLPTLASAATGLVAFDLARLSGAGARLASRAGILFNAMLLVLAGGFLAVPDAPACLFWVLTLDAALRARRAKALAWWSAAGLAAGLACLSKYSALFIAPGMILWLASDREGRLALRTPGPWLAALIAAAVFALNIAWNAEHQWLTFAKQFGRVAAHDFQPRYLVELVAGQILLSNPIVAILALSAAFKRPRKVGLVLRPFVLMGAPFAAYLVVHSLHDRVQAHWPVPLYPLVALFAAAGAEALKGRAAWLARIAVPTGFVLAAALLAMLLAPGRWFGRYDAAVPVRGWGAFSARLEGVRRFSGAAWIGTSSYGLAAELAGERALTAPVIQIAERERWRDLAAAPKPDMSRPGLIVDLTRRVNPTALKVCFNSVKPLGTFTRGDPGEVGKPYAVFAVSGPRVDILAGGCAGA
jgi:4-amino-4-deoxy-L-arabinose transferase-like glycosyltransferase